MKVSLQGYSGDGSGSAVSALDFRSGYQGSNSAIAETLVMTQNPNCVKF